MIFLKSKYLPVRLDHKESICIYRRTIMRTWNVVWDLYWEGKLLTKSKPMPWTYARKIYTIWLYRINHTDNAGGPKTNTWFIFGFN